jgi:8-amino-7-oxononanoate synthase
MINEKLALNLTKIKNTGLYRNRMLTTGRVASNFSSNDYLALSDHFEIKQAFQEGFARYTSGSGASMAICGYHPIHQDLEKSFSQLLGADNALLFSSGYAANLGIVSLITQLNAHLFIDKAVHASFYDGIRLFSPKYTRFFHNNYDELDKKLNGKKAEAIITVEGVFSMSGQKSDLHAIHKLCLEHKAVCIVDEAHSFGILGPNGLGAVALHGLSQDIVPLRMIAFGKALGIQGAIVVGSKDWIDALFQWSRSNIYSTAISPALTYGILKSLDILYKADDKRENLKNGISYFKNKIATSPLVWRDSDTHIQQLQLGCPHKALFYASQLQDKGITCMALREPTVTRLETGLRVILRADHKPEDIDNLFKHLHNIYESTYRNS